MRLSPRIKIRVQSASNKRTLAISVFFSLIFIMIITLYPVKDTFFTSPSWRNVSIYQIIKMHLSPRPTHVSQIWECPRISKPGLQRSDLDLTKIHFYDDIHKKMESLGPEEEWKKAFTPALDRENKISLVLLYGVFKHAMDSAHLGHIVMHGSAMGAWRHHGVTPWDDDIDIGIDVKDWAKIKLTLSCIEGYTLDFSTNSKWSFFKNDSQIVDEGKKRWPFLDLFLYTHDSEYAWGLNYVHLRKFVFPAEHMFPPQIVPFESFMVPVPRHLLAVLKHQYVHPETCISHHTNHKTGVEVQTIISKPCSELGNLYTMYFSSN